MITSFLNSTPWYWPALALAVSVSLAGFRPLARRFRAPRIVALVLLLGLGIIVALTLTPGDDAFAPYLTAECFVRIVRPIGFERVLNLGERGLNVLLFVPFGVAVGALPWSRAKGGLLVAGLALPFAVEGIQYLVPGLDRSCSSVDVIDNLTGFLVGLAIGVTALLVWTHGGGSLGARSAAGAPDGS